MVINIIMNQMLLMASFMGVGIYLYKKRFLDETGAQQISNILFKICTPVIMIQAFNMDFSWDIATQFVLAFFVSFVVLFVGIGTGYLIFGRDLRIEWFSSVFSNAGFMGIPLVNSLLGPEYVFYLTAFLIAFNLSLWSIGIFMITGRRELISFKEIFVSPAFIGLYVGVLFFIFPIQLPAFLDQAIREIANINTILAMLILGLYIGKTPMHKIFNKMAFKVCAVRLLVVPLLTVIVFLLIPNTYLGMKQAIIIASAAPVGVMTALFSEQYGQDYEYGAGIVSLSTLLSVVTIPIIILVSNYLWGVL